MKDSSSPKADHYFNANNRNLQTIFAKARELEIVSAKVLPYLDISLQKYCQIGNLTEGRLVIITANGSVATLIRFQTNDLLRKFKQDPALQAIREIHCKVRPPTLSTQPHQPENKHGMKPLSPATADIVRDIAESMDDPRLREAMQRIAGHTDVET